MEQADIQQLLHAGCFDHPAAAIQLRQTHISWIILAGDFAYKIKKPVDFGFLDFSTLEKRAHYCREEVRLNQRLCPDLYLDAVPVVVHGGGPSFTGVGPVIDYAVKMRKFDADATLADLLPQGRVAADTFHVPGFQNLGYRVAAFHQQAEVAEADSGFGSAASVLAPVLENFRQIEPLLSSSQGREQLREIEHWSQHWFEQNRDRIERRRQLGFVRELHGDLHTGNVALIDGEWMPFDCIEFNPQLRWIDTASDIAFLLMDLEYQGYGPHANRFLNAYLEYSGDYELLPLLTFYKVYRAMVRAKVSMLRLQQVDLVPQQQQQLQHDFQGYLDYCLGLCGLGRYRQNLSCENLSRENVGPARHPFLALMMGVSGSGKSTVARYIAAQANAIHLRSDVLRKRLFGLKPNQASGSGINGGIYTADASRQTFARLEQDAAQILQWGYAVVVDATFLQVASRQPYRALAQRLQVPFAIVRCHLEPGELKRRIRQRQLQNTDASEAGVEVMEKQLQQIEELLPEEETFLIEADTSAGTADVTALLQWQPDSEH